MRRSPTGTGIPSWTCAVAANGKRIVLAFCDAIECLLDLVILVQKRIQESNGRQSLYFQSLIDAGYQCTPKGCRGTSAHAAVIAASHINVVVTRRACDVRKLSTVEPGITSRRNLRSGCA